MYFHTWEGKNLEIFFPDFMAWRMKVDEISISGASVKVMFGCLSNWEGAQLGRGYI